MKRLIFVVPAVLILSSCAASGSAADPAKLDVPFGAEARISYGGDECTAKISRYGAGSWEFEITEPYALEGLTVTETDGKTLKELAVTLDAPRSFAILIYKKL